MFHVKHRTRIILKLVID